MELVGRGDELAAIGGLLDRCRRVGTPGLVSITGEPGSGKSALLSSVKTSLRTLTVAGYLPERDIPFTAVAPALRQLVQEAQSGDRLARAVDEPSAPVALFEAAHRAVKERPTVLVLDDAQWADADSRALVHYLLRAAAADRSLLVVLAASRPESWGVTFLGSLASLVDRDHVLGLQLVPLVPDAAAALARRVNPALTPEEAMRLAERARGSPYWLLKLARDEGRRLETRLDALTPDASELLAALVVASRPDTTALLASVLDWPQVRLEAAAEELVAAGLAVRRRAELAIAHDLIREDLERSLPRSRAQGLHLRFADVLAGASDAGTAELQLALIHRRAAGMDARRVAHRLLDDPRRTLLGPEGFGHVLEELRDEPAEVHNSLGDLALSLGEYASAEQRFLVAADRCPDASGRAAALLRAAQARYLLGDSRGVLALLEQLRALEIADPTLVEANVLEAAVCRWLLHDPSRARDLTARALDAIPADARSDTWRRIRLEALNGAHDDAMIADDVPELVRLAERRAGLAVGLGERLETATGVMNAYLAAGRLHEYRAAAEDLLGRARDAGRPTVVLAATHAVARALLELGKVDAAAEVVDEAVLLEQRMGARPGVRRAATLQLAIRLSTDDWRAAVAALAVNEQEEPDPHFRLASLQHRLIALSVFGQTDADEVAAMVERGRADAEEAACRRCGAELDGHVTETWLRVGQTERAEAVWDTARRGLDDPWLDHLGRRVEALLADARGDRRARDRLAELTAEADERTWGRVALCTRLELARILVAAGDDRAPALLLATRETAAAGGAANEAALVERWLRGLGARTWGRGPATDVDPAAPLSNLSARELAVSRHVAAGATNPEIAASLFLSRKTIERHVSSVFVKLGVRNRAELAALVREVEPRVEGPPS